MKKPDELKQNQNDGIDENDFFEIHFENNDDEARLGGKQRFKTLDEANAEIANHHEHGISAYPKRRVFGKLVDDIKEEFTQANPEEIEASKKHLEEKHKLELDALNSDMKLKLQDSYDKQMNERRENYDKDNKNNLTQFLVLWRRKNEIYMDEM